MMEEKEVNLLFVLFWSLVPLKEAAGLLWEGSACRALRCLHVSSKSDHVHGSKIRGQTKRPYRSEVMLKGKLDHLVILLWISGKGGGGDGAARGHRQKAGGWNSKKEWFKDRRTERVIKLVVSIRQSRKTAATRANVPVIHSDSRQDAAASVKLMPPT